ncbi:curculin-like lectin family protein / PAN domain-containing protein [Prunus dulcis]|uniref:Curculin-like lectin family protein / PAN domain-containing protein n=1 Tax=Prunus dulcis TaxID=3755 RepID=A0A4Y1RU96_PRUDU|nr:curculin-like lectin family protein / PAN domain-containing protein [Prunus dulcis]
MGDDVSAASLSRLIFCHFVLLPQSLSQSLFDSTNIDCSHVNLLMALRNNNGMFLRWSWWQSTPDL